MRFFFRPLVVLFLVLAVVTGSEGASPSSPPPPADPGKVIDKVVEAYGGKEALAKVQSYAFAGSLFDKGRYHAEATWVPFSRTFKRGDRLKVIIDHKTGLETRILDGAKGWRSGRNGGTVAAVDGMQYKAMVLQAARANLPWILMEKRAEVKSLPPFEIQTGSKDGKIETIRFAVLDVPLTDGMWMKALVDEKTGYIMGVGGYSTPDRTLMPLFEVHYDDFRKVDGVLFPTQEVTFSGKVGTGTMLINAIIVNPGLGEKEFTP